MRTSRPAFTMFEMLLVLLILSVVTGSIIVALDGTQRQAQEHVVQSEILEIKKAMLRFKQDMGSLPRMGQFDPGPNASPADLSQLFQNPLAGSGHEWEQWNPNSGRGWRGPYLSHQGEGWVDIGNGWQDDSGLRHFNTMDAPGLNDVRAVADPFVNDAVGLFHVWQTIPGGSPISRWGRPYLYFTTLGEATARVEPCLLSTGANGVCDTTFELVDSVNGIWRPVIGGDDVLVYVLQ